MEEKYWASDEDDEDDCFVCPECGNEESWDIHDDTLNTCHECHWRADVREVKKEEGFNS